MSDLCRIVVAIHAILLAIPATARADAIADPPDDCPAGAMGESSHSGTWCAPTTCTSDATCGAQYGGWSGEVRTLVCRPAGLCVRTEQYDPGGLRAVGEEVRATRTVVEGACAADADCTGGTRCELAPRCVSPNLLELAAHRTGCGCAVAPRARIGLGAGVPLLALGLGLRRRSRADRRAAARPPVPRAAAVWQPSARQLGGAGWRAPRTRA